MRIISLYQFGIFNKTDKVNSLGLNVTITKKEKSVDSNIKSAFLKGNPPKHATFERQYRLLPAPFEVNLYDSSSLFAVKIHAVICRSWKNRVKGRDLYDSMPLS